MKAATAAVALLAGATVVSAYDVNVIVPSEPDYGDRVVLRCDYTLRPGEHVQQLTWVKDGQTFLTYREQPREEYSFRTISDIDVDEAGSTQRRVVLNNVQDSASGNYGVRMTVTSFDGTSTTTNTFSHDQDMLVGGAAADTLGNRFGGGSQQRPAGGSTVMTSSSSSSSSSSGSAGSFGGGLGNRFGGSRPSGGASGTAFGAAGGVPPLAAAAPPRGTAESAAANSLAAAQNNLQAAIQGLQNALNNAAALG